MIVFFKSVCHTLLIIFFLIFAFFSGILWFFHKNQSISLTFDQKIDIGKPTILLDDNGNEWARFQCDRRKPITFSQVPAHVINAFIAAEDHTFWHHRGISYKGMLRSLLVNCYHGKIVQGASTITQQLVKLLFFDASKTFTRKIKEQLYALQIERHYTKEQILEAYLNNVYFGAGIYGIEAAAQRFWSKSVADLSVAEGALLAAIVKSPGQYCPLMYPLSAKKRRDIILQSMNELSFINNISLITEKAKPVVVQQESQHQMAPYLKEMIRQYLEKILGKNGLYAGGFIVQTTVNISMQHRAEAVFKKNIQELRKKFDASLNGGLLCLETQTGNIKALVGGFNFAESSFNRAIQTKRQFGSIIKPIIFTAALEKGLSFSDVEVDEPLVLQHEDQIWRPHNYSNTYEGTMTLAHALAYSNNIVAIKILLKTGLEQVANILKKCHLSSPIAPLPSLALGCIDGSLQEATALFNIIANDGLYVTPHAISWIKDKFGNKIQKHDSIKERIFSSCATAQVRSVLSLGLERLRARHQATLQAEAIGKTGTTNECRTCWFCGATPSFTTAVYIGYDNNRSLGSHVFPATTAFPIWLSFNQQIENPQKQFRTDVSLKEITINSRTGFCCSDSDAQAITISVPA